MLILINIEMAFGCFAGCMERSQTVNIGTTTKSKNVFVARKYVLCGFLYFIFCFYGTIKYFV